MPPVRETRHLWVGNIPDSVTEEKLVEYFQRYGRIDSVKILAKRSIDGSQAAFVDFVDIRCAIKAHETPNRLGDRELRTDYNEPVSSTLTRSHGEPGRRYDRGGRGTGDEGYGGHQSDRYPGNYSYKDDGPPRRDYEGGERGGPRVADEGPGQYRRPNHRVLRHKDSDSDQSGSGNAISGSGSDSSDSGDSESESESDSSVSETSRGVKKTTALQIRNLSARPTDGTIREGLYHEFKKHGDVAQIKVFGRDNNRYAIVYFRRHEDVIKAIEMCRGKMFLGLEMELTPHDDDHYEGSFHRYRRRNEGGGSFGTADDVYLFNATRTIFVGNIERNTTSSELKRIFERYGEIVDIDIKKQGSNGAYAFIQYLDITHAVEAKRQMNRIMIGRNRLKIGFGKGMPTSTIWIGGLGQNITESMLERHFQRYGRVNRVGLDQQRCYAMITFDDIEGSSAAHNDAKDRPIFGKRLRVDYASRESQHFFYDHLARTGQGDGRRYELSPPPPFRSRGNKNYDDMGMRSRGGMKQDNRGPKYHSYDHGYDRGPSFGDGGRGRGHYDDYYRGPAGGGGYESDDFNQELREYNVTRERERERERERAREREQDRRPEPPPPPRRRHYRDPGRHEVNTESDGERYYSRGEHSDVWPGDSGKDRLSREPSLEPRDDGHRRGDKRRPEDKRRGEDKRGQLKGRYEGQSEDDIDANEKQPADRKERRDKGVRKKPMEAREDDVKPEFYPTGYEKGYGDGKEKTVTTKRKVKVKEFAGGFSSEEGKLPSEEMAVKGGEIVKEEKVPRERKEVTGEKTTKKSRSKEGKKKRKNKKGGDEMPPDLMPSSEVPPGEVPAGGYRSGQIDSAAVMMEDVGFETRERRLESRVEKHAESVREEKKVKKKPVAVKSAVVPVEKPSPENVEKDRRQYRDVRRPRSPSPEDLQTEQVSRKRIRSPERDADRSRMKTTKHADTGRRSDDENHYDEVKSKRPRASREATPPPPPPPPPPFTHSSHKPDQREFSQDAYSMSSTSREASVPGPSDAVERSTPSRSSRDTPPFKPTATNATPATAKHVTSGQPSGHPSPTNSPAPAQTGSGPLPNSDDTLLELLRRHPVMWQGLLGLKNDSAAIQMHYVSGNSKLAEYSLPKPGGSMQANGMPMPPVLRIAQRMRMEASQLEGVTKRMQLEKEHCLLLALPCGRDPLDVHAQTRALKNGFIAYLQQKLAAGIINIAQPGSPQASFVLHVFPPCEFTHSHLSRVAPNLLDSATDSGHLMVVVATV